MRIVAAKRKASAKEALSKFERDVARARTLELVWMFVLVIVRGLAIGAVLFFAVHYVWPELATAGRWLISLIH